MQKVQSFLKEHKSTLLRLLPLLAFTVPFLWLYLLYPASFELMWKGRTFQLFFVWLIALELILDWEKLQTSKINKLFSARTVALIAILALPTIYVGISNCWGLNAVITDVARLSGVQWWDQMALATEYLVFSIFYCLMVFLLFGAKGLKTFSVPLFFLLAVGTLYTIDNLYPYGQFTLFQFLVPTTTTLASAVLNIMGYNTILTTETDSIRGSLPVLTATDPNNPLRSATFGVAWPCAGIESLLIFTVVVLLFLKRMPISWKAKIGYFAVGAAVTYIINILRIVALFMIGMNRQDVTSFHFYYGPLYSIAWIVAYPLIILGSQSLWRKRKKNIESWRTRFMRPQPLQPNPA